MPDFQPQLMLQTASIVIRGHLDAAKLKPSFLAEQNLIGSQEAATADIELIHQEAVSFSTEWFRLQLIQDRFVAATEQENFYEPLRDLVIGILDLAGQPTFTALGINREFHYALQSEEAKNRIGYLLVPKQYWEPKLKRPGMLSLTVQSQRPDDLQGYINVKVEPSTRFAHGIYIDINDHYQPGAGDGTTSATVEPAQLIARQWSASMSRGLEIAKEIAALG